MEEELYRRVERILYSYYRKLQEVARKKQALATVENHIKDIRRLLVDADELIPSLGMTGKYAVAVGGSRGLGSPTENIYQLHSRTVGHLQNQLAKLMHRKVKLKMRIMRLEVETEGITFILGFLEDVERDIVEQRYCYKRSNLQIGMALGMDESTVRYKRQAIIEKIGKYLGK